ncbi:hypothetical protein BGAPBR_I0026 (plasmid) [Borreliella garinii PBr]|uniref:Uncharacterized protein n=1 Tax=Borreliella garinii PBr TaxID=498743 RepID=B8F105_BORGR|nr:hypothetical protein BGAPBR_I0026 [Borreliella garinii PBr]
MSFSVKKILCRISKNFILLVLETLVQYQKKTILLIGLFYGVLRDSFLKV